MVRSDPFTPEDSTFECIDCQYRTTDVDAHTSCPKCGGELRNISVPRE